jgi:hypothetical protein
MPFSSMIRGFSKWRESTTTSPSNKHLGIYRALVQYHLHYQRQKQNPTIDENLSPTATKALQIQHLLINLAITHTHTLNRWKTVHNHFIEKIPGQPLIDKLRVIHIYEADWNLILKYFVSHQLTHTACRDNTVTSEQAGGRIGRSSGDMAAKTTITHEICRLQRLNGAVFYNDAKACFAPHHRESEQLGLHARGARTKDRSFTLPDTSRHAILYQDPIRMQRQIQRA